MWAEAAVDPERKRRITHLVGRIRRAYAQALGPWVAEHPGADAADLSLHVVALAQGHIVQRAFGVGVRARSVIRAISVVLPGFG